MLFQDRISGLIHVVLRWVYGDENERMETCLHIFLHATDFGDENVQLFGKFVPDSEYLCIKTSAQKCLWYLESYLKLSVLQTAREWVPKAKRMDAAAIRNNVVESAMIAFGLWDHTVCKRRDSQRST